MADALEVLSFDRIPVRKSPWVLGAGGVQHIPRLGVLHIHVELGLENARIIQAGRNHSNHPPLGIFRTGQPGAARGTKTSQVVSSVFAVGRMPPDLPACHAERLIGKDDRRHIRPAGDALTVTAMTLEHQDRALMAFISHRSAVAASGNWQVHGVFGSTPFS